MPTTKTANIRREELYNMKSSFFPEIVTNNDKMHSIFKYITSTAQTSKAILITGETGVGKELVARAIHKQSCRTGNFVAVNVAGLDDNVFSDTLFGHAKGAFTGADKKRKGQIELAAGGTLFLDEIGDLSSASQVKLLRLLEEGEYLPLGSDELKNTTCRIVTATNEDLWKRIKSGGFRKDLNFRLRTHHIHIPPLRERTDDLPLLVDFFMTEVANELNKKKPTPPKELFPLLQTYSFPGNIRELKGMVFNAGSMHKNKVLSLSPFKSHIANSMNQLKKNVSDVDYDEEFGIKFSRVLPTLKEAADLLVAESMKRASGNQTIASKMLGVSRQALAKRIKNMDTTGT